MSTEAARNLARMRWDQAETRQLACALCGAPFEASMPHAVYCSPACRLRASRARRKRSAPKP